MTVKQRHVVPYNGRWADKGAGNKKVSSIHDTQSGAINQSRKIARKNKGEVVIHRRDGTIRDKDSYGNDPCPPKDKKY